MFLNLFKRHVKTKLRIYCFYFALKICYWVNSACILTFTANKPNRNYKHYTLSEETFLYKKKKRKTLIDFEQKNTGVKLRQSGEKLFHACVILAVVFCR